MRVALQEILSGMWVRSEVRMTRAWELLFVAQDAFVSGQRTCVEEVGGTW